MPTRTWACFKNVNVRLLKDHHPEGYEDEWHDAGDIVQADMLPHGHIYLGFGQVGKGSMSGCFNTDAKEGIDFEGHPMIEAHYDKRNDAVILATHETSFTPYVVDEMLTLRLTPEQQPIGCKISFASTLIRIHDMYRGMFQHQQLTYQHILYAYVLNKEFHQQPRPRKFWNIWLACHVK